MEDLIADFPAEFFPRKRLVLVGRQISLFGAGRYDLLFEDEFHSKILMELKAHPLRYEDATQVAEYRDELRARGERGIVMWLVAPRIPPSVREFLDDKGIQHSEINFAEFRLVAERNGVTVHEAKVVQDRVAKPSRQKRPIVEIYKLGLTEERFSKIRNLHDDWTALDLANALHIHKSSAHRLVKKLRASAHVERAIKGKKGRGGSLSRYRLLKLPEIS